MPIGEFSERSGLSPKRLRTYAAAGLLVPAAIDPASGYRYYAPGQLRDARLIDALRRAEVPLSEIAALLADASLDAIDDWMQRVDDDADERRSALTTARQLLEPTTNARRQPMPHLVAAARTETGRVRENNEDAMACSRSMVAVADGMGGAPAGEVASKLAIALVEAGFTGQSADELAAVVRAANAAVIERARSAPGLDGMGTTICAVGLIDAGSIAVASVGDTRAYLVRDGELRQLTDDHTVVAELVRRGELSEAEAVTHPHRGVLTRVLGGAPAVDVDVSTLTVQAGDRVLLCTDGLFNELSEDEIREVVASAHDSAAAVDALADQALARGGHDNISVVLADVSA
jgi:protein phosphatase